MNQNVGKSPWILQLIGAFKFTSGLLLVALGIGLFHHEKDDLGEGVDHIVAALKLDPDNHYIHTAIEKVSRISPKQLRLIGVGTFLYALLYLVEGGGLLLKRRWAEYFTIIATGVFIPLEVYEVARRLTLIRVGVLAINIAIVAYLVYQLWRKRRDEAGSVDDPAPAPTA